MVRKTAVRNKATCAKKSFLRTLFYRTDPLQKTKAAAPAVLRAPPMTFSERSIIVLNSFVPISPVQTILNPPLRHSVLSRFLYHFPYDFRAVSTPSRQRYSPLRRRQFQRFPYRPSPLRLAAPCSEPYPFFYKTDRSPRSGTAGAPINTLGAALLLRIR